MTDSYTILDIADYLDNVELTAEYLSAAAEDPNPAVFLSAVANVAKSRGMARVAKEAALARESFHKALAAGAHPRFETISAVLRALNLRLTVVPNKADS